MEQVKLAWPNSQSKRVIVGPSVGRSNIGFSSRRPPVNSAQVYRLVGNSEAVQQQHQRVSALENNVDQKLEEKQQENVETPATEKEPSEEAKEGPVRRQEASAAAGSGIDDSGGPSGAKKPRSIFAKSSLTKVVQQ